MCRVYTGKTGLEPVFNVMTDGGIHVWKLIKVTHRGTSVLACPVVLLVCTSMDVRVLCKQNASDDYEKSMPSLCDVVLMTRATTLPMPSEICKEECCRVKKEVCVVGGSKHSQVVVRSEIRRGISS